MKQQFGWKCFVYFSSILLGTGVDWMGIKAETTQPSLSPRSACPADLATLTTQLLGDLPNYVNRTNIQLGVPNNYMIVASRPEFKPLPLGPGQRAADLKQPAKENQPDQVFFTTLERSYQEGESVQQQLHHWLFLTRTDSGWRFAFMYSIVGPYPASYPPAPPQESSDSSVATAIQIWLRDCRGASLNRSSSP